jgi:hypothetical protein
MPKITNSTAKLTNVNNNVVINSRKKRKSKNIKLNAYLPTNINNKNNNFRSYIGPVKRYFHKKTSSPKRNKLIESLSKYLHQYCKNNMFIRTCYNYEELVQRPVDGSIPNEEELINGITKHVKGCY